MDQSDAQQAIQDFYNLNGYWPFDNFEAGLGAPYGYANNYVTEMRVTAGGQIVMTFGNDASAFISYQTLTWSPTDNGNSIQWDCSSINIQPKYLPVECR